MLHAMEHALLHTVEESVTLILFLFLTYLLMEYLEHRSGDRVKEIVRKSGRLGPLVGGILGVVPQCGFSAAASNLYAGRVITLGTLMAIYLSTSDEMLPVMLASPASVGLILPILITKVVIGTAFGFLIDLWYGRHGRKVEELHIHEMCEHEHCKCEKGIVRSAVRHTVQVGVFILLIAFALNLVMEIIGEDALSGALLNHPIAGPLAAGAVGLIPNCAASVIITQLYLEGILGTGTMLAGLLSCSGMGLVVLFRVNENRRENLKIAGLLYLLGVAVGIVVELIL